MIFFFKYKSYFTKSQILFYKFGVCLNQKHTKEDLGLMWSTVRVSALFPHILHCPQPQNIPVGRNDNRSSGIFQNHLEISNSLRVKKVAVFIADGPTCGYKSIIILAAGHLPH